MELERDGAREMTRERGVVVQARGGIVRVALVAERGATCGSCSACGGGCRLARTFIEAPSPADLRPGDEVTVEIPGPGIAAAAALLLLVPGALFVAGIAAASALQERHVLPGGDAVALIVALALAALWYAAMAAYDRRLRRSGRRQPRLVEWPEGRSDGPCPEHDRQP